MRTAFVLGLAVGAAACGKKHAPEQEQPAAEDARAAGTPRDAGVPVDGSAPVDAAAAAAADPGWPELADLPPAEPWRIVDLPVSAPDAAPTSAGGPLVIDQIAVVATARAGFVAIDLTTANVLWSRRAGARVAPPVERGDRAVLVGDCPPGPPPAVAKGEVALGCFDIVDPVHVADERAGIVHGPAKTLAAFDRASGAERTTTTGDGALLWRRGDRAIRVDLTSGVATPASPADVSDHVDLTYDGAHWTYTLEGDTLTGAADGKPKWTTTTSNAVLIGAFNDTPPRIPLVRLAGRGRARNEPAAPGKRHGPGTAHEPQRPTRLLLLDMAGTDGTLGQVSHSFPGAAAEASAFGAGGATIVAIRLDDSAMRHYVAAFDGNGLPMWAWPVPEPAAPRAVPPQVALTMDQWVVVLFDDRVAFLPLVSQAPTPEPAPSRNPTP
jgi:hypothetical protein